MQCVQRNSDGRNAVQSSLLCSSESAGIAGRVRGIGSMIDSGYDDVGIIVQKHCVKTEFHAACRGGVYVVPAFSQVFVCYLLEAKRYGH